MDHVLRKGDHHENNQSKRPVCHPAGHGRPCRMQPIQDRARLCACGPNHRGTPRIGRPCHACGGTFVSRFGERLFDDSSAQAAVHGHAQRHPLAEPRACARRQAASADRCSGRRRQGALKGLQGHVERPGADHRRAGVHHRRRQRARRRDVCRTRPRHAVGAGRSGQRESNLRRVRVALPRRGARL